MATTLEHLQALDQVIIECARAGRRYEITINRLLTEAKKDGDIDLLTTSNVLEVLHCLYALVSQAQLAHGAIESALLLERLDNGD
jgi:hypothetical protein